ncbi:MAG: response regulator transcription factor [Bacteroidetes bacterium]|nr:response regulator transcription factor [Bacteroidota bacterium]
MPNITTTINCLAVDDEPPALSVLTQHISAVHSLNLVATCSNAVEALTVIQSQNIDLLFLDIQMPQLLGTDLIRTLKNPPRVIFTTAYRKFAIEGFELNAVDYLLKPISFERFLMAVNRVLENAPVAVSPASSARASTPLPSSGPFMSPLSPVTPTDPSPLIYFRADRKMQKVLLADILYIESLKDYSRIVTKTKKIITKQGISFIEGQLPRNAFIRIHRSYIVAIDKIDSYTTELIEIDHQELPIGRMFRHEVERTLRP